MRKVIALSLFISLFFSKLVAINAYPELINFRQPDKKTFVSIYMKGDEKVHWAETVDGYSLVTNDDGYFVYATLDADENMVASQYMATNIEDRPDEVIKFLERTPKKLRFSHMQVETMLSLWKLTKEQEALKYGGDVVGTKKILIILMSFKDKAFSIAPFVVRNMFNQINYNMNYAKGSVRDFYYENSYGKFILEADVVGPYTADSNIAFYGNNIDGDGRDLAREAFIAASASVDYSTYDNDGDGIMDGAHILFAGFGEEAGGGADCIWSHKWQLSEALNYNNTTISTYSCSPEFQGNEEGKLTNIGVICHELGHVFGSPDYYDTDYEGSGGDFSGMGKWDLMSSGSWNGNGACPAHHNPYTKIYIYRWATPTVLDTQSTVILNPASDDSNSFYRINTATANEYYLIENRQRKKFDRNLPGSGMMVYHAHANLSYWNINTKHPQRLYPVCAAAAYQQPNSTPSSYGNVNGSECPFPGAYNRTTLSDYTTPWIRDWDTNLTNIALNHIWANGEQIYFKLNNAMPEPLSITASGASDNSIALNWQKYSSYNVMVVCSKNNSFSTPADSNYKVGDVLDLNDSVIYVGSASSFTHKNLDFNSTYFYKIYTKINNTTYSNGIETYANTYCSAIDAFPYNETFDSELSECWSQENIENTSLWQTENSYLICKSNGEKNITRVVLPPFNFDSCSSAVMKIKMNNMAFNTTGPDAMSVWYKAKSTANWKRLQHFNTTTNAELIIGLQELSNFYLISLVAETDSGSGIKVDYINIETFADSGFIVAASTNGFGSISPDGISHFNAGDSAVFTITPRLNYVVDTVYVNGKSVTIDGDSFKISNISANHTLYATFVPKIGIEQPEYADSKISIYPNPTRDNVVLTNNHSGITYFTVYDISGKAITTGSILPYAQTNVCTTNLRKSIYLIRFLNSEFEKTEKLIIAE